MQPIEPPGGPSAPLHPPAPFAPPSAAHELPLPPAPPPVAGLGRVCASCGAAPARRFTFVEGHGMIMVRHQKRTTADFCQHCAQSIGRHIQAMTFVLGWWGFLSMFVNWVTIWGNAKQLSHAAELGSPAPTGPAPGRRSLDPGAPVTRRWQIVVPIAVGLFWLWFLVFVVAGAGG